MSKPPNNIDWQQFKHCKRIGVFDSGVGGLSILRQLTAIDKPETIYKPNREITDGDQVLQKSGNLSQALLPEKTERQFIYVADTGRFPYGNKTSAEILVYTQQIIRWLENRGVDLIIFGCNTASAIVSNEIYKMTNLPVLDLIQPTANYLGKLGLKTGVLATQATVNSHAFANAIKQYSPNLPVKEIAAAQLVNIVEAGKIKSAETQQLLTNYIQQFSSSGTEIIVLGCTHFSFLKEPLSQLSGKQMQILDPASLLISLLQQAESQNNNLAHTSSVFSQTINESNTIFFVTGNRDAFVNTAQICLGYPLKNVNHLSLNDLC